MNLRSPPAIRAALLSLRWRGVFEHARYLRFGRGRIELEVALEDVVNYRRRRAAAMTAVFDDAGCGDGRMILWRERDEPCVVLELVGRLVLLLALADRSIAADDLSRAGFAAYDDIVEMGFVRGTAGAVDDVGHRVLDDFQRAGIDLDSVFDHRRIRLGDVAVESLDVLDELRAIADAAVGNLGGDLRHLQRRGRDVTLADGDGERFRRIPSLVEALLLPRRRRNGAGILVIEIDAGLDSETELIGPFRNPIDAELLSNVVKIDVARPHDRIVELDGAVARFAPAMILASAEPHSAGAVVGGIGTKRAFLESCDRIDNFEGRAGRINSLDDAIFQRMVRVGGQFAPRRRLDAAAEDVGVEGRMRHHREHVAVSRIERDEGAVLPGHRILRDLLEIEIDGHDDAFAGRVGNFLEHAQPPPDGVNFDLLSAGVAAQKTLPHALEAEFSDLVAHVIVGPLDQIVLGYLADVAEQVRGELAVQVMPGGGDLETDAGQIEL